MRIVERRPAWALLAAGVSMIVAAAILALTQVAVIQPQPALAAAPQAPVAASLPPAYTPAPPPSCLAQLPPHYYAYAEGKEGKNSAGPSADIGESGSILAEFKRRMCGDTYTGGDKRLAVAIHAVLYGHNPNAMVTRQGWKRMVDEILRHIIDARVAEWIPPDGSKTIYMVEGSDPSIDPLVGISDAKPVRSKYLFLTIATGEGPVTLSLRLACGFQPTGQEVGSLIPLLNSVPE